MAENSHQMNSNTYAKNQGLREKISTPYNPQHNGVVERKNRTIMEDARAMIHDQDIPMHLWEEAAKTTVYVQNHTPHRVLKNNILE